ncbi:MAG: hypothetical protein GY917_30675, partial [Planctomycetaceae bacterium]|nr:hypothetical protein [Planctomycetaceae bacterium]
FDLPPLRDDDSVVPTIAGKDVSDDSTVAGPGDADEEPAEADAEEKPAATDEDMEADDPEEEEMF